MSQDIGKSVTRLDGRAKVMGTAKYSADWHEDKIAHGVIFGSSIASGRIKIFDLTKAKAVPGVIEIITFENSPKYKMPKPEPGGGPGETFIPLQDAKVFYNDQHIGVVVAETLEAAQQAARLVKVTYVTADAKTDWRKGKPYEIKKMQGMGPISSESGNFKKAYQSADLKFEQTYTIPFEHHNPMEPSATLAAFKGDELVVYDASQGVFSSSKGIAKLIGMKQEKVHAITKFVGGGFGCKGSMWPHQMIAVMAAQVTKRPVKLALTRQQMFTGVGHRAENMQKISLGAKPDGELVAFCHDSTNTTAVNKDFPERCGAASGMLYKCDNISVVNRLVQTNYQVPTFMRAPGHSTGSFAVESAIDELALLLKMDPIALRLKNYAEKDQHAKKPYSSKSLRECYAQGAEKFGWNKRQMNVRAVRSGEYFIGHGVATATYPASRFEASAQVELMPDGTAKVTCATQDIGTGTYTVMTQVAADHLGLDMAKVHFDLGDSRYPQASVSGGSTTMASVGSAIKLACDDAKKSLIKMAIKDKNSPVYGLKEDDVAYDQGRVQAKSDKAKGEAFETLLTRNPSTPLKGMGKIDSAREGNKEYSGHSFGAQFAEVKVHSLTGEVHLTHAVGAFAAGKIVNPITAKNQFQGGMIMGIGMALMEKSVPDLATGRFTTKDLADYHVPVQADVPALDVIMVQENDTHINPIGVKGIGEIGITGIAAAIANAVYNATGVRVRDLPITPDKIMTSSAFGQSSV